MVVPNGKNTDNGDAIMSLTGADLKKMFGGGYNLLDKNQSFIDSLNVFPVPDEDTGMNMAQTMKAVVKEIENLAPSDIAGLAEGIARGAFRGALGCSGVEGRFRHGGAGPVGGRGRHSWQGHRECIRRLRFSHKSSIL